MFHRLPILFCCLLATVLFTSTPARAQIVWDGEDAPDHWSLNGNWDPDVVPGAGDDVVIDDAVQTIVDQNFVIKGLYLGQGAGVDVAGNQLEVRGGNLDIDNGTMRVTAGSLLQILGGDMLLGNGSGVLSMEGGDTVMDGRILSQNVVQGQGKIQFTNSIASPQNVFDNNGVLFSSLGNMAILASDADARIDLDGTTETGQVTVGQDTTLEVGLQLTDFFTGLMTLQSRSELEMGHSWQVSSGGEIRAAAAAGQTATISGGALTVRNGAFLNVSSGRLAIESDFTSTTASSIHVAGQSGLQLNGTSTILGSLNLGSQSELTIGGQTTIDTPSINLDGTSGNGTVNVTNGSTLTINSGQINGFNNDFTGTMNVESGTVEIGDWSMDGVLDLNDNGPGTSTIRGIASSDEMTLSGSIRAAGTLNRIDMDAIILPGSSTDVAAGAMLVFDDEVTFNGNSQHTGEGRLRVRGTPSNPVVFTGDTAFDMPNGEVSFDGDFSAERNIQLNADVVVNTGEFEDFGDIAPGAGTDTMSINNESKLTVNITDSAASWTLGPAGRLHISGLGDEATSLAGNSLIVEGEIDVDKATRFDSHITLEGNIDIATGASLALNGGTLVAPNEIVDGNISGPGSLKSQTGLSGHGTISAPVAFGIAADLYAEGGLLLIQEEIVSANDVGVRDGATLMLSGGLDTQVVGRLHVDGGVVGGAAIVNSGLTEGHGDIASTEFINNHRLVASGGMLIVNTQSAPDLDGVGSSGRLEAINGSLLIFDEIADSFGGQILIGAGRTVNFVQPWTLESGGTIQMEGQTSSPARLTGTLAQLNGNISVVGPATLGGSVLFESTAVTELVNQNTVLSILDEATVRSGATFHGGGLLSIEDGSSLVMNVGASVGTDVFSDGIIQAAGGLTNVVFGADLSLGSNSTTRWRLGGTGAYDLYQIGDQATLAGELLVDLAGGYVPALNDTFVLLDSATLFGTFDTHTLPTLGTGLDWQVDYSNFSEIWLRVIPEMVSGDFNGDGDYSCADIDNLVEVIISGTNDANYDVTGDGLVNSDDLSAWLAEAGAAELASGNPYLFADANLDGTVDGVDFLVWNGSKFTSGNGWCGGDFNADGTTDGSDFLIWNANKFTSADSSLAAVPEPAGLLLLGLAILLGGARYRR